MRREHEVTTLGKGSAQPRIGVVSSWIDPEDPRVWSGVPQRVITEMRRLGVYAGHRDMTPFKTPARAVYGWSQLTKRTDAWVLRREMQALTAVSDACRRRQS